MIFQVFDDDGGVVIEFDSEDGIIHSFCLNNNEAQDLIDLIQTKLDRNYN